MREVVEGVWQLRGVPRDLFNVYLVGDVLVDTGTRWDRGRIVRQLRKRRIRLVALTHVHPDHQGSAHAICEQYGVSLACHAADAPAMEGKEGMRPGNLLVRLGERLWAGPCHPVGRLLSDGDEVAGFRVVHAPGHTPGHVMFFRESDRVVIAGDVLANINFLTRRPGLREPPRVVSADCVENRRSIRKLLELRPRVVCFGHGPPLYDRGQLVQFAARRGLP